VTLGDGGGGVHRTVNIFKLALIVHFKTVLYIFTKTSLHLIGIQKRKHFTTLSVYGQRGQSHKSVKKKEKKKEQTT
jgi:hypothetical protein